MSIRSIYFRSTEEMIKTLYRSIRTIRFFFGIITCICVCLQTERIIKIWIESIELMNNEIGSAFLPSFYNNFLRYMHNFSV